VACCAQFLLALLPDLQLAGSTLELDQLWLVIAPSYLGLPGKQIQQEWQMQ
jgi:hypothetical protein